MASQITRAPVSPAPTGTLAEGLVGLWPSPADALEPVAGSSDPVERIAFACEFLLRGVLATQGAVRAMIAATTTRPELGTLPPGIRFGLIDEALAPLADPAAGLDPAVLARLKRDLAAVLSSEAFFSLTDLGGLTPDEAIASLVRSAASLTEAALRDRTIIDRPTPD